MDFNDIEKRIIRLNAAISKATDKNIKNHIGMNQENGWVIYSFDGKNDQITTENQIILIIGGLADLKDNLKKYIKLQKGDDSVVEDRINQSLHLQLVIDIANSQKHGYPLTKPERSGKSPKITGIRSVLSAKSTKENPVTSFKFDPFKGTVETEGNVKIRISGSVEDAKGKQIMQIYELIEGALSQWEDLIKELNIIKSPPS